MIKKRIVGLAAGIALPLSATASAGAAAAAPAGPERPASAAAVCGYNDNINGRALWRNCSNDGDYIRTTNFIGGESYQCTAAHSDHDLGPTWFIDHSVLLGKC
ncbi:hypothetical protein [Streptomyces justiciae]|uniref:hypothetical protein n=1 Tax=Streptomyces justiciae TaxID=2780140 RepID=UPI00211791D9|nr:hypothetical protein [Streptomyces justiciae]MCW8382153.1 hypothetical protein [Streptomyces justiciae]